MLDVMNYAVHLAAADGNISQEERTKIAELFGYSLSEKEWIEYLRKRNLLSEDYRKNVPYTYVQVVEAENTLRATKQDYSPSKELRCTIWWPISFFKNHRLAAWLTNRRRIT